MCFTSPGVWVAPGWLATKSSMRSMQPSACERTGSSTWISPLPCSRHCTTPCSAFTEDEVPVLIFDEVDANVGGETANAVGEKMKQIARNHQVLCITHLAPVAAHADAHYVVTKQVKEGRTISEIELLGKAARVEELARMLGGTGPAARKHAEALLR